ncbi:v-type proton atpase subunit c [Anaeramoeba flamelloides]|uniref:V-type proton ATPase subunit C n=1 Tax=Anaeramoeba flamelloides TaxID=1746091 RepID=A0ABQ8Z9L3_9EUKA|nr:v-type proton atpase subunit c [Anaeramoeba flamelloides]
MFWLITGPPVEGDQKVQLRQKRRLTNIANFGKNLGEVSKFKMPHLKIGTIDSLMTLSDDLNKIDNFVYTVSKRIAEQLNNLSRKKPSLQSLQSSKSSKKSSTDRYFDRKKSIMPKLLIKRESMPRYISSWEWDESRFPLKHSMKEIVKQIQEKASEYDETLKEKLNHYNNCSLKLQSFEKKRGADLLNRDLDQDVKHMVRLNSVNDAKKITDEQWYIETDNITTLFAVIKKFEANRWIETYETLCEFVVPASSQKIAEDGGYILYTVSLFKRVIQDFKRNAREKGFTIRVHDWNSNNIENYEEQRKLLFEEMKKSWKKVTKWCGLFFGECFIDWIHLKVVRTFTESILRWGMPKEFITALILPKQKYKKKMKSALEKSFEDLNIKEMSSKKKKKKGQQEDFGMLNYSINEEYYPYVYQEINTNYI